RPSFSETLQSISLDACVLLRLPSMPGLLEARSFELRWDRMHLRFEPWPALTLWELALPLPAGPALRLIEQLGRTLEPLRTALRRHGMLDWPDYVSLDDVLINSRGELKLIPPLRHCLNDDRDELDTRPLGHPLEPDLRGTDDGILMLLGAGL